MRNMLSNTDRSLEACQDALAFGSLSFEDLVSFYFTFPVFSSEITDN